MSREVRVLAGPELSALVEQLADSLREKLGGAQEAALVGVRRGGVALSRRLASALQARGVRCVMGTVDIALYRDDAHLSWPAPESGPSEIDFPVDGRDVVIVDDVSWTGRTARAALEAVLDFGRPRRLWFVTLATRPGRELPIVPDLSAIELEPSPSQRVVLRLTEDGHAQDELVLVERG